MLMALHRWENSFCLAAFAVVTVLFFSSINTTNCSIFSNASFVRFAFRVPSSVLELGTLKANLTKDASVGYAVHVFSGLQFSFPSQE